MFTQCKIFLKGTLSVKHIHGHLKGVRAPGWTTPQRIPTKASRSTFNTLHST